MPHPLVDQLRFARHEFRRGIVGISAADARRRILPMNCISWNVGHLAAHEQRCWLTIAQDVTPRPDLREAYRYGAPASAPPLAEMLAAWEEIIAAADPWLETVTSEMLRTNVRPGGKPNDQVFGDLMQRNIYHYWYHTGENAGIRQALGQTDLPDFVGDLEAHAPYRPE